MDTQFGVYVHWPFCASKCPYCDFNSHVAQTIDHDAWAGAYSREIQTYAALTKDRTVTSIFFGGGTPSLMKSSTVESVINDIQKSWRISNDCEITLEANPTSVETEKFRNFRSAGVNRVSIGVQSLQERDLEFLGRKHDAAQARSAIESAQKIFDRYSFDLIYARPGQDAAAWESELTQALKMAGGHLSLYQLTIEKGTPFYMMHERGDFKIPEENLAADLYEITQSVMEDASLPAYEVSNHASPGHESRHNLTYWRYTDYVGIGPGAHGRLTLDGVKKATRAHRAPEIWMEKVSAHGHGSHEFENLELRDRFAECLMMGLRLKEGVPVSRLEREGGKAFSSLIDPARISALEAEGMILYDGKTLSATKEGLQRLNTMLAYLL